MRAILLLLSTAFGAVLAGLITDWHSSMVQVGAISGFFAGVVTMVVVWSIRITAPANEKPKGVPNPDGYMEYPFTWTCPGCGHRQTDTVHPKLGPFVTATCGECYQVYETLQPSEMADWDTAVTQALEQLTPEERKAAGM